MVSGIQCRKLKPSQLFDHTGWLSIFLSEGYACGIPKKYLLINEVYTTT